MDNRPRGIRNNNPGNIRRGVLWDGLAPVQTDPSFDQFITPAYGIRALVKLLLAYQDFHGLNTVEGMINRWAPPVENSTSSYVASVAKHMDVDPRAKVDLHDPQVARVMAEAIIIQENGMLYYAGSTITMGVAMATPGRV